MSIQCPCGSFDFVVEELIFSVHDFNSESEEWGDYKDFAEDAPCVGVKCSECEADCSALFAADGWQIFDEGTLTMKTKVFVEIDFQI